MSRVSIRTGLGAKGRVQHSRSDPDDATFPDLEDEGLESLGVLRLLAAKAMSCSSQPPLLCTSFHNF